MLKIVIVDDEQIVLDGMKTVLEAADRDWVVAGTAMDGLKGLELICQCCPDIVITDIKMPDMDGLEMCRRIKKELPDTVVFVFSGYAEFNLAQKAIDLGVYNYLLKPVNFEEIYAALEKAGEYIEERKKFKLEQENIKRKLRDSMPILKEKLLSDVIHGIISTGDSVFYRLKYLEFSINNAFLATVRIDNFDEVTECFSEEDKYLLIFSVRNITDEICSNLCKEFYIINDNEDSICIIINNIPRNKDFIISLCEEIRTSIQRFLNKTVSIGIGRYANRLEELVLSYNDSNEALRGALFDRRNVTVYIEEVSKDMPEGSYSIAMENSIINAVKSCNRQLLEKETENLFKQLRCSSLEYVRRVAYELYISLNRSLYEMGINADEVMSGKLDPYRRISCCTGNDDVRGLLNDVFTCLIDHISSLKQNHRSKIIGEVIKYIEEDYSRNISLKEAAERVYLNINYLSEIFKAETGENFTEYLKKFRVKKAIALLKRVDLKIYHISEMVGYSDPKHFSQVFKEVTGVSPKDYKG